MNWDQAAHQAERELPQGTLDEREERAMEIFQAAQEAVGIDPDAPLDVDWKRTPDFRIKADPENIGRQILARLQADRERGGPVRKASEAADMIL